MFTRHCATFLVMAVTVLAAVTLVAGQNAPLDAASLMGCSVGTPDEQAAAAATQPARSAGS